MNTLCTAVDRAFKNPSKSCLKCYNCKRLITGRLKCPFISRKKGMMPRTVKALVDYAREKARDCESYDEENN